MTEIMTEAEMQAASRKIRSILRKAEKMVTETPQLSVSQGSFSAAREPFYQFTELADQYRKLIEVASDARSK